MAPMLAIMLFLTTSPVEGEAAFSHRIESAATVRGIQLDGPGCAVLDCSMLGRSAWVRVGAAWTGPYTVTDCTARHHRAFWRDRGRVVDVAWSLWRAWGLWLAPFPVKLSFREPALIPL